MRYLQSHHSPTANAELHLHQSLLIVAPAPIDAKSNQMQSLCKGNEARFRRYMWRQIVSDVVLPNYFESKIQYNTINLILLYFCCHVVWFDTDSAIDESGTILQFWYIVLYCTAWLRYTSRRYKIFEIRSGAFSLFAIFDIISWYAIICHVASHYVCQLLLS